MRRARAHRFRATARPSVYDTPTSKSSLFGALWQRGVEAGVTVRNLKFTIKYTIG